MDGVGGLIDVTTTQFSTTAASADAILRRPAYTKTKITIDDVCQESRSGYRQNGAPQSRSTESRGTRTIV
jgi:hypothetical protein